METAVGDQIESTPGLKRQRSKPSTSSVGLCFIVFTRIHVFPAGNNFHQCLPLNSSILFYISVAAELKLEYDAVPALVTHSYCFSSFFDYHEKQPAESELFSLKLS